MMCELATIQASERAHKDRQCVRCHSIPEPYGSWVHHCCTCGRPIEDEYALTYDELKTNYEWALNAKRTDDEIWRCVEVLYETRASGNFLETENALEDLMNVWDRMLG